MSEAVPASTADRITPSYDPSILERPVLLVRPSFDIRIPDHWDSEIVDWEARFLDRKAGSSLPALTSGLERLGFGLDDVVIGGCQVVGTWLYRPQRNVPWSSLPVIRPTEYDLRRLTAGVLDSDGSKYVPRSPDPSVEFDQADFPPASTRILVVDAAAPDDDLLWAIVAPIRSTFLQRRPPVMSFDGELLHAIDDERIDRVCSRGIAADRLEDSFCTNWSIMLSRAIAVVGAEEGWSRHDTHARTPRLGAYVGEAMSVFAAQAMFALDRHLLVEEPVNLSDRRDNARAEALQEACPWIRTEDGRRILEWRGSGTYPPLVCTTGTAAHGGDRRYREDVIGRRVEASLRLLEKHGLIGVDAQGRMGITRIGRRVLTVLGRGAEDVDVMLRWRSAGEEVVPAIDRWINKAFRATKRQIGSCANAEAALERAHTETVGIVYGGLVPLGDRMRDPRVAEVVAKFMSYQDKPFMDRFFGLVETEAMTQPEFAPYLWYGVPVDVVPEWSWRNGSIGRSVDTSRLDDLTDMVRDVVAEHMPGLYRSLPHGFLCAGVVTAPAEFRRGSVDRSEDGFGTTIVGTMIKIDAYDAPAQEAWVDELLTTVRGELKTAGVSDMEIGSHLEYGRPGFAWWGTTIDEGATDPAASAWAAHSIERRLGAIAPSTLDRLPPHASAYFGAWKTYPRQSPICQLDVHRSRSDVMWHLTSFVQGLVRYSERPGNASALTSAPVELVVRRERRRRFD